MEERIRETRDLVVQIEATSRLSKSPSTQAWKLKALSMDSLPAVLGTFGRGRIELGENRQVNLTTYVASREMELLERGQVL